MGSGNGGREWFSSGWWRKVLLLARPDNFRVSDWAPRDHTCARREARRRNGFRAAREGWGGSLPVLAPVRSRCRLGCLKERTGRRSPRDFPLKPGTLVAQRPGSRAGRTDGHRSRFPDSEIVPGPRSRSRPEERRRPAMMDAGRRLQAGPAAAGSDWRGSGWGKRSLDSIAGSVKAFP
jgi:hypothetical protein